MSSVRVLSATMVDTVRLCPLKARYRYLDRLPEQAKAGALVLGIAVDVAAKHVVHGLRSGDLKPGSFDPREVLSRAWDEEIAKAAGVEVVWPEKGSEEKGFATAAALLAAFAALPDLRERVDRIQEVDVRFELPVPDPGTGRAIPGVFLQGVLDFIERGSDGRLRALDLKTAGSRQGYDVDDLAVHLQGSIYAWAVRQRFGDKASDEFALLVGLKLKAPIWEDRVVTLGPTAQKRALFTALHAKRVLDLGIAYPVRNYTCGSCAYAQPCANWQDSAGAGLQRDPFAA